MPYAPWILLSLFALFVLYRLRRTGTKLNWRGLLRPEVIAGAVILLAALIASSRAARSWKRPGSTTLIGALSSDMSTMAAPESASPVALAPVEPGSVQGTVRYTGSAAGYVEQEVFPRVTGWIVWMPFYAGDRVRRGQLLAKLDTREYQSREDERRANRAMTEQMTAISRLEYQQALASAAQARAEVRSKEGALEEVRRMHVRAQGGLRESNAALAGARSELKSVQAELTAAHQEHAEAEAMLQSAQAMEADAAAMLAAMTADQQYQSRQAARSRTLLAQGYVSRQDYERDLSMAKTADAKVRQAQARVQQVTSDIRAARFRVAKAVAMAESSEAKTVQLGARIQEMEARVEQAQAEIAAAAGRVQMAQGDVEAARANVRAMQALATAGTGKIRQAQASSQAASAALATASVIKGYTEIRSLVDGVVTRRQISPGTLVNPGQSLLTVAQIDPIRLQANVPEADLARIRIGSAVTARLLNSTEPPVTARVTSITPARDPVARTGVVEAVLPNPARRFLPGQYLALEIGTGQPTRGLRVPTAAILWQSAPSSPILSTRQTAYVWTADLASGTAQRFTVRRVDVQVGASDGRYTEVLRGLLPGQQVVVRGQDALRPGIAVSAVPWTTQGPESLPAPAELPGGHGPHTGHKDQPGPAPAAPEGGGHAGHDPHAGHSTGGGH